MNSILQKSDFQLDEKIYWLVSALFSFGFYYLLIIHFGVVQPDLDEHIVISENMFKDWKVPAHPMFYFFIQFFSFFSKNLTLEIFAGFLTFSIAQLAKIHVSRKILQEVCGLHLNWISFSLLLLIQLVISFSIFEEKFIVGQISPNFFHNGTMQLSIPFALLLFLEAVRFQRSDDDKYPIKRMLLFGFLGALAKPSFLFCFIPFFPAFILFTNGIGRKLLGSLQVSTLLTFVIIGQSYYLKVNPPNYVSTFKVLFLPFYHYGTFGDHLKLVFYGCFVLVPILVFEFRIFVQEKVIQFVSGMVIFAYLISFVFVDTVNGIMFSNLSWQTTIVLYILILISMGFLFSSPKKSLIAKLAFVLFLIANVGFTFFYLINSIGMNTLFI